MKYAFLLKKIRQQAKYFVILALSGLSIVVTHETPAFAQNTTSLLPSIDKITIRPQLEQQPLRRSRRLGGGYGLPLGSASVLLWNDSFCDTYSSTPIIFNCSNDLEEYRQHRTELLSTISPELAEYLERSGTTHEEHLRQRLILHTEDEYAKSCLYMQEEENTIQAYPLTITSSSGARTSTRYYQIRLTVSPNLTMGIGEWYLVNCSILPQAVIPAIIAGNFPSETAVQGIISGDFSQVSPASAQSPTDSTNDPAFVCITSNDSESNKKDAFVSPSSASNKDAIPVFFPDYLIHGRSGLGHAGILLINPENGETRYYDYGLYPPAGDEGRVRKRIFSRVVMQDGRPTESSLNSVLADISDEMGQGGRISGVYLSNADFSQMEEYANSAEYILYDPIFNNCGHFVNNVLEAGGIDTPLYVDPRPNSYVQVLRDRYLELVDYVP